MDQSNQRSIIVVLIIVLIVGVVGVTLLVVRPGTRQTSLEEPESAGVTEVLPTEAVLPTSAADEQIATEETAAEQEATSAPVVEEDTKPTARVGLQATDPGIVNLASGDIQLVEFFAFW